MTCKLPPTQPIRCLGVCSLLSLHKTKLITPTPSYYPLCREWRNYPPPITPFYHTPTPVSGAWSNYVTNSAHVAQSFISRLNPIQLKQKLSLNVHVKLILQLMNNLPWFLCYVVERYYILTEMPTSPDILQ